jgi:hypothetical protein
MDVIIQLFLYKTVCPCYGRVVVDTVTGALCRKINAGADVRKCRLEMSDLLCEKRLKLNDALQ